MRTITFATQKGGSGKSTLAIAIAVAAMQDGERVALLDTDPQGTVSNWAAWRAKPDPAIVRVNYAFQLERLLRGLAEEDYTLAIVDTPAGADNPLQKAAIRAADLCLLPARPSVADLEASHPTIRTFQKYEKPFAFVLNQTGARYQSGNAEPLSRLGVLALPCIVLRNAHQQALAAGLGVAEYDPAGKAAAEIRELWAWTQQKLEPASVENTEPRIAIAG